MLNAFNKRLPYTGTEHKTLPIPMTRERWFELAAKQNAFRASRLQRQLTEWELTETYTDIHGA